MWLHATVSVLVGLVLAVVVPAGAAHAGPQANIPYNGGAVMTGHEKVYLVFWGSQWGSQSWDANNDVVMSNDPAGAVPALQRFFTGLGTGGETWSSVMTQYCQGVPVGTQICPAGAGHVAYPTGGAFAGWWADNTAPAPAQATLGQLGGEAAAAAAHFGNAVGASNANAVYIVVSPTGTNPDNFLNAGFAAEHSWTSSPSGELAYINLPYVTDKPDPETGGWSSPTGQVGYFTANASHEYAETITDPFGGGWFIPYPDGSKGEVGDQCNSYTPGHLHDFGLQLSTGLFWVQSTWSNTFNNGTGDCVGQTSGSGILNGTFANGYYDWGTTGSALIVSDPQTNSNGLNLGSFTVAGSAVPISGDSQASQEFTVPAGGNWLSFYFRQTCTWKDGEVRAILYDIDNYSHGSQDIIAPSSPGACVSNGGWMLVTAPVIPGHLYSLEFDNQNWSSSTGNTVFKDVQLSADEPTPTTPGGIQLYNECNRAWQIYWNPVPGATSYNIYANGNLIATGVTPGYYGYAYTFTSPLNETYFVTAVMGPGTESQPSAQVNSPIFDDTAC
jgi:hypothetical protein